MENRVVSIVACGPSALKCGAAEAPGYVIAVNGAFEYVSHNAVLTMDGRFAAERAWNIGQHADFWVRWRAYDKIPRYHRDATRKLPGMTVFHCDNHTAEFSNRELQLNGRNSGYCALNLAYQMRPEKVFLYGFDMDAPTHFFGEYAWHGQGCVNTREKFAEWRKDMPRAREQFDRAGIEVFNTNADSAIKAFQYGRPKG